jgi:hypothetical protein
MQGERCMMMHDVTKTQKKEQTISNRRFFRAVTEKNHNLNTPFKQYNQTRQQKCLFVLA